MTLNSRIAPSDSFDLATAPDMRLSDDAHSRLQHNYEILAAAEFEFSRGQVRAGLDLIDSLEDPALDQQRMAARYKLPALVHECRFDEAIALYESFDPRMDHDIKAYPSYIEACARSGQVDKAALELRKVVFQNGKSVPKMIAKLYRFSSILPEPYQALYTEKFLSVAGDLRPLFKSVISLGDRLIKAQDWRGFFQVVAVLDRFDLKNTEKARFSLLMAQLAQEVGDATQFVERINQALRLLKVPPVSLVHEKAGFSLDNLRADAVPSDAGGPLVSVLMTTFNSELTIRYAMDSILAQSHRNLELIVVDDCSGDRTRDIITSAAARDARVIPIFAPQNSGTYVCKNIALRLARGEFITCHDSDDWAHPQRIATCVKRLNKAETLVATGTQVVRFSPKGSLQFRNDYVQPDAPSLMYRSEPVKSALGFYDSVRASGDTEFENRMKRAFGPEAVHRGSEVLTLALWSADSLTGGGLFAISNDTGLRGMVRDQYRREFSAWHARANSLYIGFPLSNRPFPAPAEILSASPRGRSLRADEWCSAR